MTENYIFAKRFNQQKYIMKKAITLILFLLHFIAFAQQKKTVPSGYITFNSNATFEFKNLVMEGDNVTYFNDVTKSQANFSISAIKKIVDNTGATVYDSVKTNVKKGVQEDVVKKPAPVVIKKTEEEKLVYKSSSKILLNGNKLKSDELEALLKTNTNVYDKYKKGKSDATIGTILIAGGAGLFVGGGLSNVQTANSGKSGGGPAILIVGIVAAGIGIPVRIGGVKKIKSAVEQYNALPGRPVSFLERSELKLTANGNGLGVALKF